MESGLFDFLDHGLAFYQGGSWKAQYIAFHGHLFLECHRNAVYFSAHFFKKSEISEACFPIA
jgi:hypothetical protein